MMKIYRFEEFSINEKVGVSKASLLLNEPINLRTKQEFLKFLNSDGQTFSETVKIGYRKLRPYITDWAAYVDFPVVAFEVVLEFKKMRSALFKNKYGEKSIVVGGSASGFGHKNWKNYSKIVNPIKKLSDIGLIIQIGIEIEIDKMTFDLQNPSHLKRLEDGLGSVIFHELNHSFEHYKRTIKGTKRGEYSKPIYDRSFNTALTYAENNIWKFPKSVWAKWTTSFLHYIYISESFELNARVQEMFYYLHKYPEAELESFEIWQMASYMEKFNPDIFYESLITEIDNHDFNKFSNFLLADCDDSHKIADKLKDMWIAVYKKEIASQKAEPIIPLATLEKMSCLDFIRYWGRQFNKNGRYLKQKIGKIKAALLQDEEIL